MIPAVAVALSIASCGGNSDKSEKSTSTEATTSTESQATETVPELKTWLFQQLIFRR
jgi:hypothetical protein